MMPPLRTAKPRDHFRLNVETAAKLLDFRGRGTSPVSDHAAAEQLRGAVALHNILQEHRVAYLADEVGMGKTFVALGALALLRHFEPSLRVLIIAPRANIQKKWLKEFRNFAARNVRFPDLRVKALHGAPARSIVVCDSLNEIIHATAVDADRDFLARLTSFTLPLGDAKPDGWRKKRDQLLEHLPWLEPSLFDLRNKEVFKDNFARALNCALPVFDLVIVDEGHNLKGGYKPSAASRNRILAMAFGHPSEIERVNKDFSGYGPRAKRVLFLSATPLENDYAQLWNQLDIFGLGGQFDELRQANASDELKRETARRFLIRRVTTLSVAGEERTKNLYRREWRRGGVATHDEPLSVPDDLQRLTVALIQKKVSEVLDQPRFNNRFQIGMLASFESFLETARVSSTETSADSDGTFDDLDQSNDDAERKGVDVASVNRLARDYRRRFGRDLAHPKMDSVAERLAHAFATGEKALVFVRRVASVKELQRKLETAYDAYLFERLRKEIKPELQGELNRIIEIYSEERRLARTRNTPSPGTSEVKAATDEDELPSSAKSEDFGGNETFFAWFFRGDGPGNGILSGATLQKRFSQAGSIQSTFFEDNYVATLLGARVGSVVEMLCLRLATRREELARDLESRARRFLPRVRKQQRRNIFLAFQQAAVSLLAERADGDLGLQAQIVLDERFNAGTLSNMLVTESQELGDWLETATFWTELQNYPGLTAALSPPSNVGDPRSAFREREHRRELVSAVTRLGHPFIDLYILSANRLARLELGAREQEDREAGSLVNDFLQHLAAQQMAQSTGPAQYTAFQEMRDAAQNLDLIIAVNDPLVRSEPLSTAATRLGRMLRAQQPVGGMFGQVNDTLVKQFRMPGYPLVLISTDLLQEGEDLHTFCASIHH